MSGHVLQVAEAISRRKFTRTEWRPIRTNAAERILGRDGDGRREVLGLMPLANRRDDSPRNRFEVTPDDVQLAEKTAAAKKIRADRLVSFASRRAGAAQRIRSRACLALVQLHHRERANGRAARDEFLALAGRSCRVRPRSD